MASGRFCDELQEPGVHIKPVMDKDDAVGMIKELYGLQVL